MNYGLGGLMKVSNKMYHPYTDKLRTLHFTQGKKKRHKRHTCENVKFPRARWSKHKGVGVGTGGGGHTHVKSMALTYSLGLPRSPKANA